MPLLKVLAFDMSPAHIGLLISLKDTLYTYDSCSERKGLIGLIQSHCYMQVQRFPKGCQATTFSSLHEGPHACSE